MLVGMKLFGVCLVLAGCVAVSALHGAVFSSGFEEGSISSPTGWYLKDKGMSMVTSELARTGGRSLRIADRDGISVGSSAYTEVLFVKRGQRVRATAWCYLESGDENPLGIYIDFYDQAGKRIGKQRGHKTPLSRGEWRVMITSRIAPKGTVAAQVWFHSFNAAKMIGYVDDVVVEVEPVDQPLDVSGWSGAVMDPYRKRSWPAGARWSHGKTHAVDNVFTDPVDCSRFKSVAFDVYSERVTDSTFVMIFSSENEATEGPDYYSVKVPVDFKGWKSFEYTLNEMRTSRKPKGWHFIRSVKMRANGYSQNPDPSTELVFDGIRFTR
ncbi:MAG: hypothetical protein CMO80_20835 [Verrucomicrobiales bacterium]|nr:hypothetical protein [Verrucomicrobiales bacterium]|tara:strand:- start:1377 stop:2351 length:975 start_codon:yes stop_codon:yes gene_type:complete